MTAQDSTTITDAKNALRTHAERISVDPRTNSVFAYAQDLFRSLERKELDLSSLDETVQLVFAELLHARADRFRDQHTDTPDLHKQLSDLAGSGWEAFRKAVETPVGGIVFTGHPTFALSKEMRAAFANHVTTNSDASAESLTCLLYTSPSPRDLSTSRMPSSA